MSKTLHVKGVPGVLVLDPHAFGISPPRYVGKVRASSPASSAWVHQFEDTYNVINDHALIRGAVKDGHLVACDADTAALCGVAFDESEA